MQSAWVRVPQLPINFSIFKIWTKKKSIKKGKFFNFEAVVGLEKIIKPQMGIVGAWSSLIAFFKVWEILKMRGIFKEYLFAFGEEIWISRQSPHLNHRRNSTKFSNLDHIPSIKKSTKVGLEPTTFRLEVCCATIAPLGFNDEIEWKYINFVNYFHFIWKNVYYIFSTFFQFLRKIFKL